MGYVFGQVVSFCHITCISCDEVAEMATGIADADYVCTLTDKSLKKAKDELKEDPKERLGQLQKFREFVLQQPHIKCPTGTGLLKRRISKQLGKIE